MKVMTTKELTKNKVSSGEPSYRTGYHHGYVQALFDIKFGKNTDKFTKFDGELMKWRHGKSPYKKITELQIPPSAKGV